MTNRSGSYQLPDGEAIFTERVRQGPQFEAAVRIDAKHTTALDDHEIVQTTGPRVSRVGKRMLFGAFTDAGKDPDSMVGFIVVGGEVSGRKAAEPIKRAVEPLTFFWPRPAGMYMHVDDMKTVPGYQHRGVGLALTHTALQAVPGHHRLVMDIREDDEAMHRFMETAGLEPAKQHNPYIVTYDSYGERGQLAQVRYQTPSDTTDALINLEYQQAWLKHQPQLVPAE